MSHQSARRADLLRALHNKQAERQGLKDTLAQIQIMLDRDETRQEVILEDLLQAAESLAASNHPNRGRTDEAIAVYVDLLEELRKLAIQDIPYLRNKKEETLEQLW